MNKALEQYDVDCCAALKLPDDAVLSDRLGPRPDDDSGGLEALRQVLSESSLPMSVDDVRAAHESWLTAAEAQYGKAVWADESQQVSSTSQEQQKQLDDLLEGRLARLLEVNEHVSTLLCATVADETCSKFEAHMAGKLEVCVAAVYSEHTS